MSGTQTRAWLATHAHAHMCTHTHTIAMTRTAFWPLYPIADMCVRTVFLYPSEPTNVSLGISRFCMHESVVRKRVERATFSERDSSTENWTAGHVGHVSYNASRRLALPSPVGCNRARALPQQ